MNIALWILQALLAAFFLWHGWLYLFPPAEMVEMMNSMLAPGFRVFIGVAEWLAAVGLIVPGVTRILPSLTSLAAVGLMIVTGSAVVFHLVRSENAIMQAVLFALVTVVAYVRWRVIPISPQRTQERSSPI